MIKSMKKPTRYSPGNIGLNDHANSSTHQSPFEERFGEDIGQGKMKSKPDKEKMYQQEVPQSWYEPVRPIKPVNDTPKEPFDVNLGIQRNTRDTQSVNPLFEPTLGGWEDVIELDQGYKPIRRGNNPQNPSQRMPLLKIISLSMEKILGKKLHGMYRLISISTGGIQQPIYGEHLRENQWDLGVRRELYEEDLVEPPVEIFLHHNDYKEVIATWSVSEPSRNGSCMLEILREQGIIEPTFTALSKGLVMHSSQQRNDSFINIGTILDVPRRALGRLRMNRCAHRSLFRGWLAAEF
ncbi:hypothetical protein RHGRI_013648 [Rhododendron griersonianum]|uniref:Uncharacterized protein n=1 Tax=Rhododendron griersonianum TaxID=479676 RepID=A0AAV6K6M4_9ERIC|nr:hypothetical protein RHGRI_013648 [Rhododendron griersonianum]